MVARYAQIETGIRASETMRRISFANQNTPQALQLVQEPQWYDVKQLIEAMFDARTQVRDTIAERREAETRRLRFGGHPGRQLITAEIHSINMQLALDWHEYRNICAAYHAAWSTYQRNLRRV